MGYNNILKNQEKNGNLEIQRQKINQLNGMDDDVSLTIEKRLSYYVVEAKSNT